MNVVIKHYFYTRKIKRYWREYYKADEEQKLLQTGIEASLLAIQEMTGYDCNMARVRIELLKAKKEHLSNLIKVEYKLREQYGDSKNMGVY